VISWKGIPHLPFELAVLPRAWLRLLRLQVVSYALPALIAIGLCLEHHRPSRCPVRRTLRWGCRRSVLALLQDIQPASGGFLEAVPLTSFVAMSLLPLYGPQQPVVKKCLEFLKRLARPDGSWPIDTNLSVWVTTRALEALDSAGALDAQDETAARKWLLALQHQHAHPFTMAEPGAWSWTHLSGGVPDADDTPGALIALSKLGKDEAAQQAGLGWLLDLQNDNGGWPTFCRGWGKLPFDRSAADITAHVLRALRACDAETHDAYALAAAKRAMAYLESSQRPDGSWLPLWFGNQYAPGLANPVYGTARVLRALAERAPEGHAAARGVEWLLGAQNPDGGWGGNKGVHSTVEESALAITGLTPWISRAEVRAAVERGVEYLVRRVEDGAWTQPAPIGLYFARLWYSEELYPVVWTVEALGRYLKGRA
jgi:squalene-hopene/tetraprenyl-beta-curcumene cyclase